MVKSLIVHSSHTGSADTLHLNQWAKHLLKHHNQRIKKTSISIRMVILIHEMFYRCYR